MNWAHTYRIAWKDGRRIGGLWIAMFVFWVICLCYVTWGSLSSGLPVLNITIDQVLLAILSTAMIYALGWAGLTFAAEHEDKTYGFLRTLPVTPKSVFYGKLLFGVSSTILLVLALIAICFVHLLVMRNQGGGYTWRQPGDGMTDLEGIGWSLMVFMIPLAMAVGLFWSLRVKRPLLALTLAAVFLVVIPQLCILATWMFLEGAMDAYTDQDMLRASAGAGLVIAIVSLVFFVIDRNLAIKWLPNFQGTTHTPTKSSAVPTDASKLSASRRLFWLQRKQSLLSCAGIGLLGIAVYAIRDDYSFSLLALLVSGFLGVIVFRPDHQEKRFRLLAQFGASPKSYWGSRLLIPGFVACVLALVQFAGRPGVRAPTPFGIHHDAWAWWLFFSSIIVFCIGQFCSLAFPSTIIACSATLISSIFLCLWLALCAFLRIPWWLGYLPFVLLCLLASYLRIPRWFRETGSWKQWVVPAIPLVLGVVGIPLASAIYRVYQIPSVVLPVELTHKRAMSTDQRSTAAKYRAVFAELPLHDRRIATLNATVDDYQNDPIIKHWVSANPDFVQDLLEVTNGPAGFPEEHRFANADVATANPTRISAAAFLIRARQSEEQGNIDEAWKYYVGALKLARHRNDGYSGILGTLEAFLIETSVYERLMPWALSDGNTPDRIENAALFLEKYRERQPPWTDAIAGDYQWSNTFMDDPAMISKLGTQERRFAQVAAFAPWELTRAHRFRDYRFAEFFDCTRRLEDASGNAVAIRHEIEQFQNQTAALARTTFLGQNWRFEGRSEYSESAEVERRAVIYRLAAMAYRARHGNYPAGFDGVMLGDKPLPDDFYSPGNKMQIASDDHAEAVYSLGPFITSAQADPLNGNVSSAAVGADKLFLLPATQEWDEERFARRMYLSSNRQRVAELRRVAESQESYEGYSQGEEGGYASPYGFGSVSPPNMESRLQSYTAALWNAAPQAYSEMLTQAVRDILVNGVDEDRLAFLSYLSADPTIAGDILTEIKTALGAANPRIAIAAAAIIKGAVVEEVLTQQQFGEIKETLSTSVLRSDAQATGVPIRNHANGHFYEVIRAVDSWPAGTWGDSPISWKQAKLAAASRRFRDMEGHLVTITSAEENAFLLNAFCRPDDDFVAWIGASHAEGEGGWKWETGPESGDMFYRSSDAPDERGFANWAPGQPRSGEQANFVCWLFQHEPDIDVPPLIASSEAVFSSQGHWVATNSLEQISFIDPSIIVEYSPTADALKEATGQTAPLEQALLDGNTAIDGTVVEEVELPAEDVDNANQFGASQRDEDDASVEDEE